MFLCGVWDVLRVSPGFSSFLPPPKNISSILDKIPVYLLTSLIQYVVVENDSESHIGDEPNKQ